MTVNESLMQEAFFKKQNVTVSGQTSRRVSSQPGNPKAVISGLNLISKALIYDRDLLIKPLIPTYELLTMSFIRG